MSFSGIVKQAPTVKWILSGDTKRALQGNFIVNCSTAVDWYWYLSKELKKVKRKQPIGAQNPVKHVDKNKLKKYGTKSGAYDVKYTWNNSYIWTAVVDQSEEWSSQ